MEKLQAEGILIGVGYGLLAVGYVVFTVVYFLGFGFGHWPW